MRDPQLSINFSKSSVKGSHWDTQGSIGFQYVQSVSKMLHRLVKGSIKVLWTSSAFSQGSKQDPV